MFSMARMRFQTWSATMPSLYPAAGVSEQATFVHAALRKIDRARCQLSDIRAADSLASFIGSMM